MVMSRPNDSAQIDSAPLAAFVMSDADCVAFLQWALPRLALEWAGFRKVRGQVCKRLARRMRALGLVELTAYREYLKNTPAEWARLDALCRITISRFRRDRGIYQALEHNLLPALAGWAVVRGHRKLRAWSAGCSGGEEPYSLNILWKRAVAPHFPDVDLAILATDVDADMLARARIGCYGRSSLKEMPADWLDAFATQNALFCVKPAFREGIRFIQSDLRTTMVDGPFELILCRNLAFTYFATHLRPRIAREFAATLAVGGALIVGIHEELPGKSHGLAPLAGVPAIYVKCDPGATHR